MRLATGLLRGIKCNLKNAPILESANELTIQLNSNSVATISYVKVDEKVYDLVHTLIPEQLQGQGLGHLFAERIFDHLIKQDIRLKLSCEFLQHFYSQNIPKYIGRVIEEQSS
ncbi:hypothetical protein HUJ05_011792 [Dendroctonus ponderosae]|nr:hypothetical protein HUJ05_011792 [Dendroctonus ponderosae]